MRHLRCSSYSQQLETSDKDCYVNERWTCLSEATACRKPHNKQSVKSTECHNEIIGILQLMQNAWRHFQVWQLRRNSSCQFSHFFWQIKPRSCWKMPSFDLSVGSFFFFLSLCTIFDPCHVDTSKDGIWHLSHSMPKASSPYVTVHIHVHVLSSILCRKLLYTVWWESANDWKLE